MKNILAVVTFFVLSFNGMIQAQTLAEAKAILVQATKEFKALPADIPIPIPPAAEPKCKTVTRLESQQINLYIKQFQEPERTIIIKILGAHKIYEQLKDAAGTDSALALICKVSGQLKKKAIKAIKGYGGDSRYFYAVSGAAMQVDKNASVFCGDPTAGSEIMDLLVPRVSDLRDQFLKQLKEGHDYSMFSTIMNFDKQYQLLGGHTDGAHESIYEIFAAFRFQITIEQELQKYFDGKLYGTYKANGKVVVGVNLEESTKIKGEGKMKLTVCRKTQVCQLTEGADHLPCTSTCELQSYSTGYAELFVDACDKNELVLNLIGFGGPDVEHWTSCANFEGRCATTKQNDTENREQSYMAQTTNMILIEAGIVPPVADFLLPDYNYGAAKFSCPLKNNNAEAGRFEIVKISENKEDILKLIITVTHYKKPE